MHVVLKSSGMKKQLGINIKLAIARKSNVEEEV